MVTRYTEVGQQSVYLLHTVVPHPVLQVAEVAAHEGEVLGRLSVSEVDVFLGIGVLVKAVEVTLGTQLLQDGTTVTAATKGDVHINPVWTDLQTLQTFAQHNWNVILGHE